MKKFSIIIVVLLCLGATISKTQTPDWPRIIDSLTTIDPEIRQYFPRWKVCETDLQIQIYQSFVFKGFNKSTLDMQKIEILASPKTPQNMFTKYELLMVSCGQQVMTALDVEESLGEKIIGFLSGELYYQGAKRGLYQPDYSTKRDYCYEDIPVQIPITSSKANSSVDYIEEPNDKDAKQAITASLFKQCLKIGSTGFWLKNIMGTDEIGYPFWYAGEGKIILKRPLYPNLDYKTNSKIPFLINAFLGAGYRVTSGITNDNSLDWIASSRKLNTGPGGKIVGGFDFHLPSNPYFGVRLNAEIPLKRLQDEKVLSGDYAEYDAPQDGSVSINDGRDVRGIIPILRSSGQFNLFYNWWLDQGLENFVRFDFGINYYEIYEMAETYTDQKRPYAVDYTYDNTTGLKVYKPNELGDWIYFKAQYRSQLTWPWSVSLQYSNQILLSRLIIPLFGNFLFLEAKYSTPLRGTRPFEIKNFFMISPLFRFTIN